MLSAEAEGWAEALLILTIMRKQTPIFSFNEITSLEAL